MTTRDQLQSLSQQEKREIYMMFLTERSMAKDKFHKKIVELKLQQLDELWELPGKLRVIWKSRHARNLALAKDYLEIKT